VLLHLAVSNVVQNAVELSPLDGTLRIESRAAGAFVELTVADHGPGIPDFAKTRVFERFFSLQRPDTGKKSTGLGLDLVREVATLHGGSIHLENRPERGLHAPPAAPRRNGPQKPPIMKGMLGRVMTMRCGEGGMMAWPAQRA
jgi:two-component system sensor histidine kinase CreC